MQHTDGKLPEPKAHYLVDIYGCSPEVGDADYWLSRVPELCESLCLNILDALVQRFSPQGATLLYVLAESHLAIHTWPEENFATIEVFTCRPLGNHEERLRRFLDSIPSHKAVITVLLRGDSCTSGSVNSRLDAKERNI